MPSANFAPKETLMKWTPGGESQDMKIAAMNKVAEAAVDFNLADAPGNRRRADSAGAEPGL